MDSSLSYELLSLRSKFHMSRFPWHPILWLEPLRDPNLLWADFLDIQFCLMSRFPWNPILSLEPLRDPSLSWAAYLEFVRPLYAVGIIFIPAMCFWYNAVIIGPLRRRVQTRTSLHVICRRLVLPHIAINWSSEVCNCVSRSTGLRSVWSIAEPRPGSTDISNSRAEFVWKFGSYNVWTLS
jgi:hypothetical protein